MTPNESALFDKLRANFEGREAIYVEKGALRVCVSNIRLSSLRPVIRADADELPTLGLGVGGFAREFPNKPRPLHWTIAAGFLTQFSDTSWQAGYGGWQMYFDPKLVHDVVELAAQFPNDMDNVERYRSVARLLARPGTSAPQTWHAVFPDHANEVPS